MSANVPPEKILVFISYSHDSDRHRTNVLRLSERLRADGVETILDQYVEQGCPSEGWPRWMMNGLDAATHVVVVCTETYYRRFRGKEQPGRGKGVDWEGALVTQELYDARSNTRRFLPIVFKSEDISYVPEPLRGQTYYLLDCEDGYQAFYDRVLAQNDVVPGVIGTLKRKPQQTVEPLDFDSAAAEENRKPTKQRVEFPRRDRGSLITLLIVGIAFGIVLLLALAEGRKPAPSAAKPVAEHDREDEIRTPALDAVDTTAKEFVGLSYVSQNAQGFHEYCLKRDPTVVLIHVPNAKAFLGAQGDDPSAPCHFSDAYPDEQLRWVSLRAFFIGKHELTKSQFNRYLRENSLPERRIEPGTEDFPVSEIDPSEAESYCIWAGLRLPTADELEFAARGIDGRRYPWGNDPPDEAGVFRANYSGYAEFKVWKDYDAGGRDLWAKDGFPKHAPVDAFPNGIGPFGTYQQAGNVWEWTADSYKSGSKSRIFIGGAFGSTAFILRPSYRNRDYPAQREPWVGLRVCRDGYD